MDEEQLNNTSKGLHAAKALEEGDLGTVDATAPNVTQDIVTTDTSVPCQH